MIDQTQENSVSVFIGNKPLPAVTGVSIAFERDMIDKQMPAVTYARYRVKIERYLPVGLQTETLFGSEDFAMTVVDGWNTFSFPACEWLKLTRDETADGVTETYEILSLTATVV